MTPSPSISGATLTALADRGTDIPSQPSSTGATLTALADRGAEIPPPPSATGATSTAPADRGADTPPPPATRPMASDWLPPRTFLPPGTPPPALHSWSPWHTSQGTPHRPRSYDRWEGGSRPWEAKLAINDLEAARDANQVYDSIEELAKAMQAQLAVLADSAEFQPWRRNNPEFKPRLSGFLATAQGVRRVTVLLDTGATHCFICARLAAALGLQPSGQPGPLSVSTASTGGKQGLGAPVQIYLGLGDVFRESMSISPMDMDVGDDLILGWDWISSHDLRHLFVAGLVDLRSGTTQLQLDLLPAAARPAVPALTKVIGHGEFRRLLRQIVRDDPEEAVAPPGHVPASQSPAATPLRPRSKGWSRPAHADHVELATLEATARLAARARRSHRGPDRDPEPPAVGRFTKGVEVLRDGTVLHLASFCLADAELRLTGTDDPAFTTLKAAYADVLGGAPPGLPPDRGMELVLETGDAPMPRSRPIKRLSEGELAELRTQLIDLLDRGWIQHSTAGHAASVVFARKPDGTWRICYDYRGLNAITRPAVEPLPHIDALLDGTRGSCYFTKLDLASSYHQLRMRDSDRWKTSFRSQLGQFEWNVVPYGLQGSSSLLMRVMNQALTVGLDFQGDKGSDQVHPRPAGQIIHAGVPGASGPLGRCALAYMDDCLVHSPTLEQHLLDVAEVLEIFRRRRLYAKSSKCEFGRQELGFLGHRLSREGVSVDPRKVQSITEWTTPTSCSEVRRFTGLANYYRRFVEGYAEVAAPLTALGSPTARFAWTPEAQTSFDTLKLALSSAPVLRIFDPSRRAILTTDASGLAVAAILTQPDDEGRQHPVAYESRKLTAAERNYPAHVLELLAVVHALRIFRHYLLGSGAPRPAGCRSDFDLRTDNQAITWLKTNRHLNKMYVRWLDEIEDFRFDVTHLPGTRNPADPLTRRGFADGDGPAASTGDPDPESQQELFSRLGRDAPMTAVLAAIHAGWKATRRAAATTFASAQREGDVTTPGGGCHSPGSPPCTMFTALAGAALPLGTGTTAAPSPPVPSNDLFLAPGFIRTLTAELAVDAFFGPIMRGAAATFGRLVDRHGDAAVDASRPPKGGGFLVRCGLLYRRGQGEADRLCIPAGGGLRAQVLRECHDGPLGGHFGRAKTGSLVCLLAFWVGQDVDVAEYARSCQTCQRTKADHGGPRGLLHPLPLPSRRGGMIGVDWIAGLPTTAAGFDMIQNHVDLLSGKVHAVATRATATASDAAEIIRDMCLRSGAGFPDVLVVDHDPKFTSEVFRAFVKGMGSCLIVGSAYHKNTNAKVERANGVIGDTLRAFANGRKDDWDKQLPLAEFAINNAASTLGDGLTPFFIDRGAHPRLPLSPPRDEQTAGESPAHYARRMHTMETTVRELLAAAQAARKTKLDAGRVDTVFRVGDRVLLRTKELLDAADIGKLRPRWDGPFTVTACPSPNAYTLALPRKMRCSPTVNVDRLKPFFERADVSPPPGPVSDAGREGEHEVELLLNRRTFRGATQYLVRWRGHASPADEWLRVEALAHCPERVAEYDAVARNRRAARHNARRGRLSSPDAVPSPAALVGGNAPPTPPSGFRIATAGEVTSGRALVGRAVLYCWPAEGWVRGRVVRQSRAAGFSHVVGYGPKSALGAAAVTSLLDAASHGPAGRWVLLLPAR